MCVPAIAAPQVYVRIFTFNTGLDMYTYDDFFPLFFFITKAQKTIVGNQSKRRGMGGRMVWLVRREDYWCHSEEEVGKKEGGVPSAKVNQITSLFLSLTDIEKSRVEEYQDCGRKRRRGISFDLGGEGWGGLTHDHHRRGGGL